MFNKIKSLFKSEVIKDNIYIHIPKCGGSSFVGLLKDSVKISKEEQLVATHLISKVGNTKIEHINFSTLERKFKAPDIFKINQRSNFKEKNLFMLVRNPIDRLFSEFNFQYHILNGKGGNTNAAIISRLSKIPHSFDDYIKNKETQNYQCKFLIGRKIADPAPLKQKEYDDIISAINELNIHCGITKNFEQFLNTFSEISNIKLKKTYVQRKKTPFHFKDLISKSTEERIKKLNKYDFMLYKHIKNSIKNNNLLTFKTNTVLS